MAIAVAEGAIDEVAEHKGGFRRRWYRTPSFVAGLNFQRPCTIAQAASSSTGLPLDLVTSQSPTEPSSLTRYLTTAVPCSCRRIESSG